MMAAHTERLFRRDAETSTRHACAPRYLHLPLDFGVRVWTITLYMLTVILYPPDLSKAEEHQRRFQRNRTEYYSAFIAMCVLDIEQTAIHGDLFHPVWYVPFVGRYAVLAAVGLVAHRRAYDRFFAWYLLITLLIWSLVVRRYLVPDAMP